MSARRPDDDPHERVTARRDAVSGTHTAALDPHDLTATRPLAVPDGSHAPAASEPTAEGAAVESTDTGAAIETTETNDALEPHPGLGFEPHAGLGFEPGDDPDSFAETLVRSPIDPIADTDPPDRRRSVFDTPTARRAVPIPLAAVGDSATLARLAPVERELIAAIARGDDASRLVYADWLEERGEPARAAFLRCEAELAAMSPDDPRFVRRVDRLRELAAHIDGDWRAHVARPAIEGCRAFDFACPRAWSALALTVRDDVRFCGSCRRNVYYFDSVDDARDHAVAGHCVAIDVSSQRWENDLVDRGQSCPGCTRQVPSRARFCPHCGHELRVAPRLGGVIRVPPRG